jgi:hypothetical protein
MKKTILTLAIVAFALLSFQTAFAEMGNKRVTLQVETKDPLRTYNLALSPIWGPLVAHNYLASSPVKWREDIPEVKSKAIRYALLNVATIAGGIWMMSTAYEEKEVKRWWGIETEVELKPFQYTLGLALATIGPIIENHFFGNYCAKLAVDYNKKLYKQFDYNPPVSLNLQKEGIKLSWNTQF